MNILNSVNNLLTWMQHARTRYQLLEMNDRALADIGISRELLAKGVGEWPWRAPGSDVAWSLLDRDYGDLDSTRAAAELEPKRPVESADDEQLGADTGRRHAA